MSKSCSAVKSLVALVGRICISLMFIVAGIQHVIHYDQALTMVTTAGVPYPQWALIIGIIFELGGGILVFLGLYTRFGAFLLFVFIFPATYYFYTFWTGESADMGQLAHLHHAFKNLSILGAMIYLMAFGAGAISFDWFRCRHKKSS